MTDIKADGIWRPECEPSGNWVAVRYVETSTRGVKRELDGRWWKGQLLPTFHATMAPCEARCKELNGGQ